MWATWPVGLYVSKLVSDESLVPEEMFFWYLLSSRKPAIPAEMNVPGCWRKSWSVQPWSLHDAQQGNLRKSLQNSYFKIHMTAMSQTKFFVQMPGFEFWNNSNCWRSCKQAEPDNRQNSLGQCWMHYLWGGKCKFYARFLLRYSLKTTGPTKSFLEFGSSTVHHMSHPSSLP